MHRHLILTLGILAFGAGMLLSQAAPQRGQAPPAATATGAPQQRPGTIRGLVIRAGTNDPLSDVQVRAGRGSVAVTDSSGRFVLENVPPGQQSVNALLDGYFGAETNGNYPTNGTTLTTVASDKISEVTIAMVRGTVVTGRVFANNGRPVSDAQVQLYRLTYPNGSPVIQQMSGRTSDDRGEYRLYKIPPGDYYLAANPRPASGFFPEDPNGKTQQQEVRTYYPGVTDVTRASMIALRPGDELGGININIQLGYKVKVTGRVVSAIPAGDATPDDGRGRGRGDRGARGDRGGRAAAPVNARGDAQAARGIGTRGAAGTTASVELRPQSRFAPQDFFGAQAVVLVDGGSGTFTFQNVSPGLYDVFASMPDTQGWGPGNPPGVAGNPQALGRSTIEVRNGDVDGVTVSIRRGVDLRGRITLDGTPVNAPENIRLNLQPDDSGIGLPVLPVYSQIGQFNPKIAADGTFAIAALPEGHFRFQFSVTGPGARGAPGPRGRGNQTGQEPTPAAPAGPPVDVNAYLADVLEGGISIYDQGLNVATNPPGPIDIVLKTNPGKVSGTLVGSTQNPISNAQVHLVPSPQHRGNPARYISASTNAMGQFTFNRVPVGEYKLFAWESSPQGAFQNADYVKQFEERGVSVNVTAGSAIDVRVPLIVKPR